jgi:hypothetical protein
VCIATGGMEVYIGVQGRFHHLRRGGSVEVDSGAATTWPMTMHCGCTTSTTSDSPLLPPGQRSR